MKKYSIPISTIVSLLIGGVSLCLLLGQGFRLLAYPTVDLAELSDKNLRAGQYVQGEISEVFTVQTPNGHRVGNHGEFMKLRDYLSYTVWIGEGRYIRVWLYDKEALAAMERLVQGAEEEISFSGQIKRRSDRLNTAWYSQNPEFDETLFIADYEIWQKSPHARRDLLLVGLYGMIAAALIYYLGGGLHSAKLQPESTPRRESLPRYSAGVESEITHTRGLLKLYRKKEKEYRIEAVVGAILVLVGGYIDFGLHALGLINWIGLAFLIYGIKSIWTWFFHSKSRIARRIARMLGHTTLQDKRETAESYLRELERDR